LVNPVAQLSSALGAAFTSGGFQTVSKPLASIVICTFNRAALLRECLGSVSDLIDQESRFEIIVVDNNSNDETPTSVDRFRYELPTLRYVREEQQGLSYARNRGLREATADWIAYLDDDARVLPGYMERLNILVGSGAFDCIGGVYVPWYRDGRKCWYLDEYASNAGSSQVVGELGNNMFVSGGICLFRRDALLAVGGFPPALGMTGNKLGYGEETRVQVLMRDKGCRIGFDPEWRIEHFTSLSKQSMRWMLRSAYASGRDSWQTFGDQPTAGMLATLSRKLITRPVLQFLRSCRQQEKWRSWRNPALAMLQPLALTSGQLLEGLRIRWKNGR
jgi:GT2 family glycosyltransferase